MLSYDAVAYEFAAATILRIVLHSGDDALKRERTVMDLEIPEKIGKLIQLLSQATSEQERVEMVIFGSAAIVLHGIDLGREVNDLDVFASDRMFERLSGRYAVLVKPAKEGGHVPFIQPCDDIEILKSFPGVEFEKVLKGATHLQATGGFKVGCLADLKAWKLAQGRAKDLADIGAIDRRTQIT